MGSSTPLLGVKLCRKRKQDLTFPQKPVLFSFVFCAKISTEKNQELLFVYIKLKKETRCISKTKRESWRDPF